MFNFTPTVRNLIVANALLYFLQSSTQVGELLTQWGSLYPLGSAFFYPWQFLSYMFLHANLGHLFSNMFGLLIFGPMLEQRWGGRRLLTYWLICGVGAGVLYEGVRAYDTYQLNQAYTEFRAYPGGAEYQNFMKRSGLEQPMDKAAAQALSVNPRDPALRQNLQNRVEDIYRTLKTQPVGGMLGASGALFGVLFAFGYLFPNTEILLYFAIPIKAKYLVIGYGAYELYKGLYQVPGDNVAHFAHLGGLLVGFIVLKFWERGRTRFY